MITAQNYWNIYYFMLNGDVDMIYWKWTVLLVPPEDTRQNYSQ